ncbi:glycosyltransferase [Sphingobacterium sp. IITKGP-BTPF85]|uniref:glycosyltransferase n=1 Tax=Sphingobacterium sp. IITKGP-BTPF85 TaxID=1338009 RepID=UPI00042593CC|nr:glycosyltransferase [Sphingobacterium sp. IITKGP-BTPF85]
MSTAPIILFVYNRPDHTLRTLKALENNNLASESELFIYADAAKNEQSKAAVEQVREIISRNWKFKTVTLILRESNCGLAANVIDGVTKIVKQYGQVIVLEDDLVTSPFALQYFNDALELYRHQDQVMQISGYGYPVKDIETLPETFFFRVANSWGWATWDRAWNHFNSDINNLTDDFTADQIHQFSIEGKENFWKQVKEFKAGKINSWAIRWYASVLKTTD